MQEIILNKKKNGMAVMFLIIVLWLAAVAAAVFGGLLMDAGVAVLGVPLFVVGILWACIGWIPAQVSGIMKSASKFLMVTALAAIGLNTSLTDFKKAGLKPMFYGITIDTLVTLTALVVIWCMGLM